jgi:serine/threonine protein kinase
MVSKDGFVKVLEFGLAKLTDPVPQAQSALPTALAAATQPGTVMGTAGYMSPEQASGQPVDFRSASGLK